jgi:3-hydroxybutyryl-CoA dehydrogenase
MEIKQITVIGGGSMGHGIVQVCAQSGFNVCLVSGRFKEEAVQDSLSKIKKFLQGSVDRQKMTQEQADGIMGRIKGTANLKEGVQNSDFIIEAVVENLEVKHNLFKQVDELAPPHAIFASNTSYQSITEVASVTKRPEKFVGTHWFNPPQIMRGVEVVFTEKTSKETLDTTVDLCKKLGKEPAVCNDSPGFIANHLLGVWRNEAFKLYDRRAASLQDIDTAFKVGYNFRMGQFELGDLVGLDVALIGASTLYKELGKEVFAPARCHVMKVRAGDYGRKTGRGFYEYK